MPAVLLANVGERDLLPEETKTPLAQGVRAWGEELLSKSPSERGSLRMPILSKALEYLRTHLDKEELVRVVLFATDQPTDAPATYRSKDTIFVAQIMGHLICQDYLDGDSPAVDIRPYTHNPSDHDQAWDYFSRELPHIKSRAPADTTFYACVSGGTPAMNTMLLLRGVNTFGARFQALYIVETLATPLHLRVGEELLAQAVRQELAAQIRLRQFAAALRVLENNPYILASDKERAVLRGLLAYGRDRRAFDFDSSATSLAEAACIDQELANLQDEARNLAQGTPQAVPRLLREVFWSAHDRYDRGEYSDFLVKVGLFLQGALAYILEAHCEVRYSRKRENWGRYLGKDWRAENPTIAEELERQGLREELTMRSMMVLLEHFASNSSQPQLREMLGLFKELEGLSELRNENVHRFGSASRQDLKSAFGLDPEGILPTMQELGEMAVGHPLGQDPYQEIADRCISLLSS